jgi:hypothetical protein
VKRIIGILRKVLTDDAIATALNRTNLRTPEGNTWTATGVTAFRRQHRIPAFNTELKERHGWMMQVEAATSLSISPMSVARLVQIGIIPAEQPQPGMPAVIKSEDLRVDRVIRAVAQLKDSNNRPLSEDPNQLYLFETRDL